MSHVWRTVFVLGLLGTVAAGCGGQNPYDAAEQSPTTTASMADNQFIPTEQDLSECIGAVEQPDCGSEAKGGWRQYLVMAVLVGGLSFIAWRVVVAVRRRDAIVNATGDAAGDRIATDRD